MPFYYAFFVFTIVFATFYSGMAEIFKVRQTKGSWKTVVFASSNVSCQAQGMGPALFLPVEADTNFYKDKTKHDTVYYFFLGLLCNFHFHPLISFRFWHTSQGLHFDCM